ncbi:Oidioi.mRNA.OKI2018_I69.chr1.g296.t1.cds [Oikopleura dioica]|uniref:Oidioi.mRNA.OKI2018_I69.chr1.g296.t1.cds n=1 Tax=Oikopleura dioica TaxID=34765 RepID=A0ABN7SN48_OIKDI|nr:Oidioi.mRNA.OKI2018_I69.chr1.g296.t1.cds [Oikopleura dioica]
MKLTISSLLSLAAAEKSFADRFDSAIERNIQGNWVSENFGGRIRRDATDQATTTFAPIAAMISYLRGDGLDGQEPANDSTLKTIEDTYTSYGCYCWANGPENPQSFGGGRTKDMVDRACSVLYRCYKCIDLDYSADYTTLSYTAVFTTDATGERMIDCSSGNAQSSGENLCLCDLEYVKSVVQAKQNCDAGILTEPLRNNKSYCINNAAYQTISGGGTFDHTDRVNNCPLEGISQAKNQCCGRYPHRRSYDDTRRECCEFTLEDFEGNQVTTWRDTVINRCEPQKGGTVVVNDPNSDNPHAYIPSN